MREKTPLFDEFVCVQKSFIILVRNYLFLKIYVISEGAASHNVLYYQQLSNAIVTKSVFKLIFVLSNYQTCTFHLTFLLSDRLIIH